MRCVRLRPPRQQGPLSRVWQGHFSPGEGYHMMRRLFTIASAFSLLLCVATCVLWVQSYFGLIGLRAVRDFDHDDGLVQIRFVFESFRGGAVLEFAHHHAMTPASAGDLLQDHQWHRPIEAWWDSAAEVDASQESYLPRQTYRFSP